MSLLAAIPISPTTLTDPEGFRRASSGSGETPGTEGTPADPEETRSQKEGRGGVSAETERCCGKEAEGI